MEFIKRFIPALFAGIFVCFLVDYEISKYGLARGISLGFGVIIINMLYLSFKK